MNELQLFNYEGKEVRTVVKDGEPWVVAKDVCELLGYAWKGQAAIAHVPEDWRGVTSVQTPSGIQEMVVLSEQGLYFFLARSDKPGALPFQMWIAGEIIPTIRRTGSYSIPQKKKREKLSGVVFRDEIRNAELIAKKWNVPVGLAYSNAVDRAERITGEDFREYKALLPAREDVENMKAVKVAGISEQVGLSVIDLNKFLYAEGLQEKVQKGKKHRWVLTEAGKEYGEMRPFTNHGYTDYEIFWYPRVVDFIKDKLGREVEV